MAAARAFFSFFFHLGEKSKKRLGFLFQPSRCCKFYFDTKINNRKRQKYDQSINFITYIFYIIIITTRNMRITTHDSNHMSCRDGTLSNFIIIKCLLIYSLFISICLIVGNFELESGCHKS